MMKKKNDEIDFRKLIKNKKIPVLTLDNKWHELFIRLGKPSSIEELEARVNELLKQQGKLINDIKSMKQLKKQLVNAIVANMDTSAGNKLRDKKLSKNKALIEDINTKLSKTEEDLSELPYDIAEANHELMAEGMSYCYDRFKDNCEDISSLAHEIEETKKHLAQLMEDKHILEESNSQMYSYLHNILGHELMERFDELL